jgi:hypothetical protein
VMYEGEHCLEIPVRGSEAYSYSTRFGVVLSDTHIQHKCKSCIIMRRWQASPAYGLCLIPTKILIFRVHSPNFRHASSKIHRHIQIQINTHPYTRKEASSRINIETHPWLRTTKNPCPTRPFHTRSLSMCRVADVFNTNHPLLLYPLEPVFPAMQPFKKPRKETTHKEPNPCKKGSVTQALCVWLGGFA